MNATNLKITLRENTPFLKEDGKFDLKKAMLFSGHIGGICYNPDGLEASFAEVEETTEKRINTMTAREHQTVFEHVSIGMHLSDSSKILNMVLNNEGQHTTSERSLRYTRVDENFANSTDKEIELYNKWNNILTVKITEKYGNVFDKRQISTLANENARYMVSTFINTSMFHTLPLAQLNRIVTYMKEFINKTDKDYFEERLSNDFVEFIGECERLNLLDDRLQSNRKHRGLRIFGKDLDSIPEEFGVYYSTTYKGSFAEYAQAERHRTGNYEMERNPENGFFIPPIIEDDPILVEEWLEDINSVKDLVVQGELLTIHEGESFDNFILKLKERDCSRAQLEIFDRSTLLKQKYYDSLKEKDHPYAKELEPYMGKRRCGYPDYDCAESCGFVDGINGTRKI